MWAARYTYMPQHTRGDKRETWGVSSPPPPHYSGSWGRSQDIRCGSTFTTEWPHQLWRPLTCGLLTTGSSPSQVSGISSQLCPCVLSITPILRPAQVFLMSPSVACLDEHPIIHFLIDASAFSNQLPEIHHVPLFWGENFKYTSKLICSSNFPS